MCDVVQKSWNFVLDDIYVIFEFKMRFKCKRFRFFLKLS